MFELKPQFNYTNSIKKSAFQPWDIQKTQNQSIQKLKKKQLKQKSSQIPDIERFLATIKKTKNQFMEKKQLLIQKIRDKGVDNQTRKQFLSLQKKQNINKINQISMTLTPLNFQYKLQNHQNQINKMNIRNKQKKNMQNNWKEINKKTISLSPYFQRPTTIEGNTHNQNQRNNFQRLIKIRKKNKSTSYEVKNQNISKNEQLSNIKKAQNDFRKFNQKIIKTGYDKIGLLRQKHSFFQFAQNAYNNLHSRREEIRKKGAIKKKQKIIDNQLFQFNSDQLSSRKAKRQIKRQIKRQKTKQHIHQKINLLLEYRKDYKKINFDIFNNDKML